MYNVFSNRAIIQGLPQLDNLLTELSWECLNELEPAISSTYSRIVSISEAKEKGYFSEKTKPETIRNWIKNGTIPSVCVRKIGRRYFFKEHSLIAWIMENKPESDPKGGEEKAITDLKKGGIKKMWQKPQRNGRCRLNLGANLALIADPLRDGKESFRLEYWDVEKNRCYLRLNKNFITSREQAIAQAEREIERMNAIGKTYNSSAAITSSVAGDYTVGQVSAKFLLAKKRENIRSFNIIKTAIENRLVPHFGSTPMSELNLSKLREYRDMRREKVQDVSIKNDLAILRLIFNWAIQEEIYAGENSVKIRPLHLNIGSRERYMSRVEQEKIWAVLEKNLLLKDLATFAVNTPMRPQNIIDMEWDRINFEEKVAIIPAEQHKQGVKGNYILNNTNLDLLERRKRVSDNKLVFHFENGQKVTMRWTQQNWKAICEEVGILNLHFYDLKHTLLSRLASNGSNVWILKRISNHASVNSLEKYVKMGGMTEAALTALNAV